MSKGGGREKEKTLPEKLKGFFSFSKGTNPTIVIQNVRAEVFTLSPEIIRDISKESSLNTRLKTMKDLCEHITVKHLEDCAVECLYVHTIDLLHPQQTIETRHTLFNFYCCLIKGQLFRLKIMKTNFFKLIKSLNVADDMGPRLELFKVLCDNGREIDYFEEEIGPFLLDWMPDLIRYGKASEILPVLVNLIKFHSAYFDDDVLSGLLEQICAYSWNTKCEEEIELCIVVLEVTICYSNVPVSVLLHFVTALCYASCTETFVESSWQTMRNLLGTSLGHIAIYTMCQLLHNRKNQRDHKLLKGAVHFLWIALWSDKSIPSLKHPPTAVVPAFRIALDSNSPEVALEVVHSLEKLVEKQNTDLGLTVWNMILDIVEKLLSYSDEKSVPVNSTSNLNTSVHNFISLLEQQIDNSNHSFFMERLFKVIESSASKRPEESVLRLIHYRKQRLNPDKDIITDLNHIMKRYFREETRPFIRIKALQVLSYVLSTSSHIYEEALLDQTVLPFLSQLESVSDSNIRKEAIQLLVQVAESCATKHCLEILDIIEKVIQRPFDHSTKGSKDTSDTVYIINEEEVIDVRAAVVGLISIFKKKLHLLPSGHAVRIYKMLISHIQLQYGTSVVEETGTIRKLILEFLLRLRTNSIRQTGVVDNDGHVDYSVYLLCAPQESDTERTSSAATAAPVSPTSSSSQSASSVISYLHLDQALEMIVTCLKKEKDWTVLQLVLSELPKMLQNKALLEYSQGHVNKLTVSICTMIKDRNSDYHESLRNTPSKFLRFDFQLHVFPVICSIVSYHKRLTPYMQSTLIKSVTNCLGSKSPAVCVEIFFLCTLEMKETMFKSLTAILLGLSRITANAQLALPSLEFLANLEQLPEMHVSFVEDDYVSIFAIALPYTNSFKFNQFTVAFAHHVISMWFLKCKIPCRKLLVRFIIKGLRANIIMPFEENAVLHQNQTNLNEDSLQRRRSSSLNDASGLRQEPSAISSTLTPPPSSSDLSSPSLSSATKILHTELMETCIDLMARFTFGMCTNTPKRSGVAEFLLENGQRSSWILGNRIITITTSGCGTKAFKNSLCERCYKLCRCIVNDSTEDSESHIQSTQDAALLAQEAKRKRHHSAIQRTHTSRDTHYNVSLIKDDLQLHYATADTEKIKGSPWASTKKDLHKADPKSIQQPIETPEENLKPLNKAESRLCSCWCSGWAEVFIHRPTGNTSWMMRIQNELFLPTAPPDISLSDLSSLLFPTREETSEDDDGSQDDSSSQELIEQPPVKPDSPSVHADTSLNEGKSNTETKVTPSSKGILRRTNSSPDMKVSWTGFKTLEPIKQHDVSQQSEQEKSVLPSVEDVKNEAKASLTSDIRNLVQKEVGVVPEETSDKCQPSTVEEGASHPSAKKPSSPLMKSDSEERHSEKKQIFRTPSLKSYREDKYVSSDGSKMQRRDSKVKLRLDLSNITNVSDGKLSSPPHPHSAPFVSAAKIHSPPRSPYTKKTGSISPPTHSSPYHRDRGHTISVMSPLSSKLPENSPFRKASGQDNYRGSMNPSFVFLQLYHSSSLGSHTERPLLLSKSDAIMRSIDMLDRIPPYDTHKIGVVYVGPGQANNEASIFSNEFGSMRYVTFLRGLGTIVKLQDVDIKSTYVGGLDLTGADGKYGLIWHDDVMQVIFHVATLMPNKATDPNFNDKKKHIANDFVTVVYNESGEDYSLSTIKGQFNFACVIIRPENFGSNVVTVKVKPELLETFNHGEPYIISDESLSLLVRQLAVHANLASVILQRKQSNHDPYGSNWLERLRQIKRIRSKMVQEKEKFEESQVTPGGSSDSPHQSYSEDFTDFV